MNFPVFDFHCDTALSLLGRDMNGHGSLRHNLLHIDLERAGTLPGYAQCFACFTTPFMQQWAQLSPETVFQREMDGILSQLQENGDLIRQAFSAEDVRSHFRQGLMSAILTIEGPAGFGFDPERLEELYRIGFRVSTLGWNEQNVLCGSHKTGGGLTDLGREYVKEAQRLGMIVDVSHISDEAFWDIMDITQSAVIASHSNSRAVCGESRNLTDDMFRQICQTGGVAGFNQCAPFVGEHPDLDTACDHFLHFLELDPDGKHIALGGDLDGCDTLPEGFNGVQDYPKLAQRLLERGVNEELLKNIYWENALGVMDACCM
ncbi:MAG: membrane dipeptidase [Firmicutes bacterium]|nr:membrane dipeptidase [Bacillota bacterium]